MRLILRKEVENLGDVGDVVEVADGYGLNYLIPRGMALHATASTVRAAQHERRLREAQVQAAKRGAEDFAGEFSGVELEFTMRVGEDGRLFGSVTNRMIEDALRERGLAVNRRKILLEEPIKKVGAYEVAVRLHQDVRASIRVRVVPDETFVERKSQEADAPPDAARTEEAEARAADSSGESEPDAARGAEADEEVPE